MIKYQYYFSKNAFMAFYGDLPMKYKKAPALLLCLAMFLSLLPAAALAEEGIEAVEDDSFFAPPIEEVTELWEEPVIEEPLPEAEEEPAPAEETPLPDPEPLPEPEPAEEEPFPPEDFAAFETVQEQPSPAEIITGFEPLGEGAAVAITYQFSLFELEKLFPEELRVTLAGSEALVSLPVTWRCAEDYDEALDEFHFLPELSLPVAEGVEPPIITVQILRTLTRPVMEVLPRLAGPELPVVGILTAYPRLRSALPAYYNAYEQGLLPEIRDQNPYGTCWAHSTIGCMEADLIHDGAADTDIDLSERQLIYYTFHDYTDAGGGTAGDSVSAGGIDLMNHGGDISLAVNRLSNLAGPARESAAPYSSCRGDSPAAGRRDGGELQLAGAYRMSMEDRDAIKFNIMEHGGVETACYASDEYYSPTYNSYYCSLPDCGTNHSIMLVGWDDSFSRSRFGQTPAGDGAWLVRNSWGGQGYSYYSYFWLSYYDKSLKDSATALDVIDTRYDFCYACNGSPFTSYYTMESGVKTEQRFNVRAGETISAIGVDTMNASLNLSVSVTCGGTTVTQSCCTTYPGYHLIPLQETIPVTTDAPATVQISYTGGDSICIPIESGVNYGGIVYTANCASGGMTITDPAGDSFNTGSDGLIRLFTNKGLADDVCGTPDARTGAFGQSALEGPKMRIVYVPDLCTDIGAYAFSNCTELTQIRLPKNCTIDSTAFSGCGALSCIFAPAGGTTEAWCRNNNIPFAAE